MEEPPVQHLSIKDRIAALNLGQVGQAPEKSPIVKVSGIDQTPQQARPPVPTKRPEPKLRGQSVNVPVLRDHGPSSAQVLGNEPIGVNQKEFLPPLRESEPKTTAPKRTSPPALPSRRLSEQPPPSLPPRKLSGQSDSSRRPLEQRTPALPPRRPSDQRLLQPRSSIESLSSIATRSSASTDVLRPSTSRSSSLDTRQNRSLPPIYDQATLPPTPPKRPETRDRANDNSLPPESSSNSVGRALPTLPPRLPPRAKKQPDETARLVPKKCPNSPRPSALSFALDKNTETPPPPPRTLSTVSPSQIGSEDHSPGRPPPVPLASRPKHMTSNIVLSQPQSQGLPCLKCWDFSGPDTHATRFPRETLPSMSIEWLAHELTSPFHSAVEKFRAIYTWLHHNIAYDVDSFFNNNVKPSTPVSTLSTGLAVCEGYAGLFAAIATKAGLECIVVGGHGKGYGFTASDSTAPIPAFYSTHAWNAIKLDNGSWKLIDATWGAGYVQGKGKPYVPSFNSTEFTMTNEEFGLKHYPTDRAYLFRADGRDVTWEEYFVGDVGGEHRQIYGHPEDDYGFSSTSILPRYKAISVVGSAELTRFQFLPICEHWDFERMGKGKPYIYVLNVEGIDGRKKDIIPFETNGRAWWLDIPTRQLGAPGQGITISAITTFDGRDGRGLDLAEFIQKKGRVGMAWMTIAAWVLT